MEAYKIKQLLRLIEQLDKDISTLCSQYSGQRSPILSDLSNAEINLMLAHLFDEQNRRCGKTVRLVVHKLCLMGYTRDDQSPDYKRIDGFIKHIGTNNPECKKLKWLKPSELNKVASQVVAMYENQLRREL